MFRRLMPLLVLLPAYLWGGGLERAVLGGSARRVLGRSEARTILRLDRQAHAKVMPRQLARPKTVFRYTSKQRAAQEVRRGIPAGSHMTATGGPGRPVLASTATTRYGLLTVPQARETVRLPKGFPVRHNHVTKGARGYGELTSPKRVPPRAIRSVVPLRR